jgi:type II secretory pathway component PulF
MAIFFYKGFDKSSKEIKGYIDADTCSEAKKKLQENSTFVEFIQENKSSGINLKLKKTDLISFTLQLSQMLSAGIGLIESLETIKSQSHSQQLQKMIIEMQNHIRKGGSFSQFLEIFPNIFSPTYIILVKVSEEIGKLEEGLRRVSKHLQNSDKLKKQLIQSLIYPCFVVAFSFVSLIFLCAFVIPSLESLYDSQNLEIEFSPVIVLGKFCYNFGWVLIPLAISFVVSFFLDKVRFFAKQQMYKIPVLRTLLNKVLLLRFLSSMGILMKSGVSLTRSLECSLGVIEYLPYLKKLEAISGELKNGEPVLDDLCSQVWMTPMVRQFLKVGVRGGNLEIMIEQASDFCEEELMHDLKKIHIILTPMLILFVGIVVGIVVMELFLPLFQAQNMINI